MKMTLRKRCVALIAGSLIAVSTAPAFAEPAASTAELLRLINSARVSESEEHKQREAEFQRNTQDQQRLLNEAKAAQSRQEERSGELEQAFADNELKIEALRVQLNERLGSLRELFGHLTSTAGDVRANINQSIVTAQYPDRGVFIDELIAKMSSDTRLPSIEEIERLWAEITREMVESGKVVKFEGSVINARGDQEPREIVRIGDYNLVSNGRYLDYNAHNNVISELPRQPSGAGGASSLQNASSGFTSVIIDPTGPTGGNLLKALIDTPTMVERFHQGGLVGYIITGVGVIGLILALWRFVVLYGISSKVNRQLKNPQEPKDDNALGRVLLVARNNPNLDAESLELKLNEVVIKESSTVETGLNLLKVIAAVAPLIGLLGTVTGMIVTFQQITIFGAGDPKTMAGGISMALVTTVQGLCVAIPALLFHTLLSGRAQRVLSVLEEQSAGIIAENAEG